MKTLKTYGQFTNEALSLKQYKRHAYAKKGKGKSLFKKKRYEELFQKYKKVFAEAGEPYGGDRNAYRLYMPLIIEERENELESEIRDVLKENGYEIIDYFKGTCKHENAKNPSKIGSILTRLGDDELMKAFVEDPERKKGAGEDLMVVLCRHPYDIIGSDTDRDWTNCFTIPLEDTHPRMKALKEKLAELQNKLESEKDEDKKDKIMRDIEKVEEDIQGHSDPEEGNNIYYLKHEVKEGSLTSYLIKKTDKNINNPLAVLNIKPYYNEKGDIWLRACDNSYSASGAENQDFKNTVMKWLEDLNANKEGSFIMHPKVYPDENITGIFTKGKNLGDFIRMNKWTDEAFGSSLQIQHQELVSLKCAVDISFEKIKELYVEHNKLETLEGIEKFQNIVYMACQNNKLTTLEGVNTAKSLQDINCSRNPLVSLKGVEGMDLTNITLDNTEVTTLNELRGMNNLGAIYCTKCKIKDLDVLKYLPALTKIECKGNPLEKPLMKSMMEKFGIEYTRTDVERFSSYEFQKDFLTRYPKRIGDLKHAVGEFNPQIIKEFDGLIRKWEEMKQRKLNKEAKKATKQQTPEQ